MQSSVPAGPPDAPRTVRRVLRPRPPAEEPQQPEAAGDDGRLLRPAVSCPRCGARPAMRVTPAAVRALDGQPAAMRIGTYQCQRRGCGAIYDIGAAAFQRAG